MEDNTLRVHGNPTPKGNWLKEVRVDAARNAIEHLRRQEETREFEEAKARGITPEEIIAKGKEDLKKVNPDYDAEYQPVVEKSDSSLEKSEEVEELKKQLKAERAARTKAENKLQSQDTQSTAQPVEETKAKKEAK